MFLTIDYLRDGNLKQRQAFDAFNTLNIFHHFKEYTPVLCGTIPIGIDIEGSDLDIIMEVRDFNVFEEEVKILYGTHVGFQVTKGNINNTETILVNFSFMGFDFELFGQDLPVSKQNAYLHMVIEHKLLDTETCLRDEIIALKKQGLKTEPAFCKVLGLTGEDPYSLLLQYGKDKGLIK